MGRIYAKAIECFLEKKSRCGVSSAARDEFLRHGSGRKVLEVVRLKDYVDARHEAQHCTLPRAKEKIMLETEYVRVAGGRGGGGGEADLWFAAAARIKWR